MVAAKDPHVVSFEVPGYKGEFHARIREFQMALGIELKTDSLIIQRGFNPSTVSDQTRGLFSLLALFSTTCEETPDGFSVEALYADDPAKSTEFLLEYGRLLREAEESFRAGTKSSAKEKSVG